MRKSFTSLAAAATFGAILALILGFFGSFHPALDTFSHLRFHLGLVLFFAGVCLPFAGYGRTAVTALFSGLIAIGFSLSGLTVSADVNDPVPGKPVYSMFHLNLLWIHKEPDLVIDRILELEPEIVSLAESSIVWIGPLARLGAQYPYFFNCPEYGARGGVRLYSKWAFDVSEDYCGDYGVLGLTKAITPADQKITIGSLHLRWPWPASGPKQMDSILPALRSLGPDVLIAGDFNATTWSHAVSRFAETGKLEIVNGIGPTWLFSEFPGWAIKYLGFPIDNVATRGRVRVLHAKTIENLGSDHLPIWIEFQIE